jgi:hypothetical protein
MDWQALDEDFTPFGDVPALKALCVELGNGPLEASRAGARGRFETLIDGIEAFAAWVRSTNGRQIAETGLGQRIGG